MVHPDDHLMLVTDTGRVIRIAASSIRVVQSRGSKGVRLMRLEPGERIVDMARLEDVEDEDLNGDGVEGTEGDASEVEEGLNPEASEE